MKDLTEGQLVSVGCLVILGNMVFWLMIIAACAYAYRWAVAPS